MRTHRSHLFIAGIAATTVLGLSACVPSANDDKKTIETLDPLTVTLLTNPSTSNVTTTTIAGSDAVIITAGTVVQPTSAATLVPPADTGDASATTTTVKTPTTSGATTTTSASGAGTYVVVAKDTLFGIAKRCSVGPEELANFNDWKDGTKHVIIPGQKIKTPCVVAAASTDSTATTVAGGSTTTTTTSAGGTSSGTSTTVSASPGGTYTVQAGDFLSGIAAKTGTTVAAIVAANGWADGDKHVIQPGQIIKMPVQS